MKTYILPLFGIALLFVASCSSKPKELQQRKQPTPQVEIIVADYHAFSHAVKLSGTVKANEVVDLFPEVNGRIVELHVPDGAYVEKGTVLLKLNDAELQAQLMQLSSQLTLAKTNRDRLAELLKIRGVNQSEFDAAENEVIRLQAQIQIVKAQIDKTIIKAPFSGNLGLRLVSPGAFVTTQTKISTLQQTNPLKLDFQVPELYAKALILNKIIECTTSDNKKISAKIIAIEPYIESSTRNIKIRALIHSSEIMPGAFVTVHLAETNKSIVVPTNAIIPDANDNKVAVVKQGKVQFVPVLMGKRSVEYTEIESGITPGDSIIVSGMLFVRPNQQVEIQGVQHIKL